MANLQIPDSLNNVITANSSESRVITMTLTNSGNGKATIENLSIPGSGKALSPGLSLVKNDCSMGKVLMPAGNTSASCAIQYKFGPTATVGTWTHNLEFTYKPASGQPTTTASANLELEATQSTTAAIRSERTELRADIDEGGDGSMANPLKYVNMTSNKLNIQYTYTNTGRASANNFKVDSGTFTSGFKVAAATCAYADKPAALGKANLASGDSCNITLTEDKQIINGLIGQISLPEPGYVYNDGNIVIPGRGSDIVRVSSISPVAYNVLVNELGGNIFNAIYSVIASNYSPSVTFTPDISMGKGNITVSNGNDCTTTAGNNCSVELKFADHMPEYDYNIPFTVRLVDGTQYRDNMAVNLSTLNYSVEEISNSLRGITILNEGDNPANIEELVANNLKIIDQATVSNLYPHSQCIKGSQIAAKEKCYLVVTPQNKGVSSLKAKVGGKDYQYNFLSTTYDLLAGKLLNLYYDGEDILDVKSNDGFQLIGIENSSLNVLASNITIPTVSTASDPIYTIGQDQYGKIYAAGKSIDTVSGSSGTQNVIAKLNGNTWQKVSAVEGNIYALAFNSTANQWYVGGSFNQTAGDGVNATATATKKLLAILNANGDWVKLGEANNDIQAVSFNPLTNKLYVAGKFTQITLDTTTLPTAAADSNQLLIEYDLTNQVGRILLKANGSINTIAINGNSLYLGGNFSTLTAGSASSISSKILGNKLLATYNLVNMSLDYFAEADNEINAIVADDGAIQVGGKFENFLAGDNCTDCENGDPFVVEFKNNSWSYKYGLGMGASGAQVTTMKSILGFVK